MNKEDREALTITKDYQGGPATLEMMQELHYLVAVRCLEYLREILIDKMRAQMLSVIRSFLRDNGIKAEKTRTVEGMADALGQLQGEDMPFH